MAEHTDKMVIDGVELVGIWKEFMPSRILYEDVTTEFLNEVKKLPGGETIAKCYQCGTCTGGCTLPEFVNKFNPRGFINLVRRGHYDLLVSDYKELVWRCVSCNRCTHRCPKGVNTQEVVRAIAKFLEDRKVFGKLTNDEAFDEVFMDEVINDGRIDEVKIVKDFYAKTGRLKEMMSGDQLSLGFKMFTSGRIKLFGGKVKDWKKVSQRLKEELQ
ncbi:MAG: 4Fe-4S dicluster domain-containing protein [bacterium]